MKHINGYFQPFLIFTVPLKVLSSFSTMSDSEDKHDKRIRILEDKLKKCAKGIDEKESCWPFHKILGIALPFVSGILLFFLKPSFVVKPSSNPKDKQRDWGKLALWTFVVSAVGWAMLYAHYYYFGSGGKVCTK